MSLMQERQERAMEAASADGIRKLKQTEMDIFEPEPEQLSLAVGPKVDEVKNDLPNPPKRPKKKPNRGGQTPDIQMSPPHDIQVSPPHDIQVSPEETIKRPRTHHHPAPQTFQTPKSTSPETEIVVQGGGISLTLSSEELEDIAECVERAVPVFDGLLGRPGAQEVVDAALCVPWLGKKFRMNHLGIRAHCLSYARIEANRHWKADLEQHTSSSCVTRTRFQQNQTSPRSSEALPEGVSVTDLLTAFDKGGTQKLTEVLYADRPQSVEGASA